MNRLNLYSIENIDQLAWPDEDKVSTKTPALNILTDFQYHRPLVIDANVKAVELETLMKKAHVKMKIVLDHNRHFVGVIGLSDLTEEKILRKVTKDMPRSELLVKDFMHHRDTLKCFDFYQLAKATVGDVLETQQNNHQQHCLVVDRKNHQIRGLISARDVARSLKRSVDIEAHISFEELFNEIYAF